MRGAVVRPQRGWPRLGGALRLDDADAQPVALIPRCAGCEAVLLPADEERWQAWLTDDKRAGGRF
jgi:hypothetical protein